VSSQLTLLHHLFCLLQEYKLEFQIYPIVHS
jgi:hypothetical protein